MSTVIAIISEYNPFHNGHEYQIKMVREMFDDCIVVSIMSGNVVQRGEFALFDKYSRAKAAVKCGVDVVFELPFPFSSSNAEKFATTGVKIASLIGADYLCFGTENYSLEELKKLADVIDSEEYESALSDELKNKEQSFIRAKEAALSKLGFSIPYESNSILGVEYIRALNKYAKEVTPLCINRVGSEYDGEKDNLYLPAHKIRETFYRENVLKCIPDNVKNVFEKDISDGKFLDEKKSKQFLYQSVLIKEPELIDSSYDTPVGCGTFIKKLALDSNNSDDFFAGLSSKSYTTSRLKRTIIYSVFNIRSIDTDISFLILLGANKRGCDYLNDIKGISIISNTRNVKELSKEEQLLYKKNREVDSLYYSFLGKPNMPSKVYKNNPYIE